MDSVKPRWHRQWRGLVLVSDAVCVTVALTALAVARFGPEALRDGFVPAPGRDFAQTPVLFAVPVWLAVFAMMRLYSPQRCRNGLQEAKGLVTAGLGAGVALVLLGFLVKENPARSWLLGGMVLATMTTAVGRQTVRSFATALRRRGRWLTRVVVVGRREAKRVVEMVVSDADAGLLPVGTCGFTRESLPSWDLWAVREAVTESGAAEVLVVSEDLERQEVAAAVEVADTLPVNVVVLPGLDHLLLHSLQLVTIAHEPGLAIEAPSLRTYQRLIKRAIDVAAAGLLLLFGAPLMVVSALAVRVDPSGPLLFRQRRAGLDGKAFELLKFRTMRDDASDETAVEPPAADLSFLSKPEDDPRVTRVGRWLRRWSLDELPQLWNVLRGDMSLVGPRPLPIWEAERVAIERRLVVRPGLTGLWQVNGRSALSPQERIRLDLVYVQNWNLLLDLSILLRTVPTVLVGRGAH